MQLCWYPGGTDMHPNCYPTDGKTAQAQGTGERYHYIVQMQDVLPR